MTRTAHDLNSFFKNNKPSNWETLGDLLKELGVDDASMYTFLGQRFPNDPKAIALIPESSLREIHKITAISNHIGG